MDNIQMKLLDLVVAAIDLANSVKDDVQEQRSISDETVVKLNKFALIYDNLDQTLDFENFARLKGRLPQ